ncbi:hypothetical protein DID88_000379 [Monilinia fructigena]|uniref:Uncharacterized protein n=1 Tax=Monilinia fructigena TaxID=38457 RepID=A0A395IHQ6_9HELO|nr:hypothetical protein DID88_000379 [Monilinia fructigena]
MTDLMSSSQFLYHCISTSKSFMIFAHVRLRFSPNAANCTISQMPLGYGSKMHSHLRYQALNYTILEGSILNAFPSPRYPLQIIDSFGILSEHVIKALHQGLKRRREHDDQISQLISDANIEPLLLGQPPAKMRQISKGKGVAISIAEDSDQENLALADAEPAEEPNVIVRAHQGAWKEVDQTQLGNTRQEQAQQEYPIVGALQLLPAA